MMDHCVLYSLSALLLVSYVFSSHLDTKPTESDAEALSKLLEDLKKNYESAYPPTPLDAPAPVEQSNPSRLAIPRKRNCGVNFVNDCGAHETAYMNGARKFFGKKRQFNDNLNFGSTRRVAPSMSQSDYIAAKTVDIYPTQEAPSKFLQYLINLQKELEVEKQESDDICIELTGQPCREMWIK